MQSALSEEDLALIHALQIWPRASWSALAPILAASPITLANRWSRLRDAGLAWVTTVPVRGLYSGYTSVALVEVDCARDLFDDVVARLERMEHVVAIEHAARGRDLLLTVSATSFDTLAAFLVDELNRIPGVTSSRTHLAVRVHMEGSQWRLDALDPSQCDAVTTLLRESKAVGEPANVRSAISSRIATLEEQLAYDGRFTAAELAERLSRPPSTIRRQLTTVLASRHLAIRCEVAQLHTRWPITVTWWCRLPGVQLQETIAHLRNDGSVRMCMSLTGPSNFAVQAWVSDMADLMATQARLEQILHPGEIADSSVTLRTRKRNGWLLHPDGRSRGEHTRLT